jgi:hypothetical protein
VQQFILDLIIEIVDNYDIDGIQFDDHFGLPVEFGYEPLTVSMYQEQIKSPPSDDARETFWVRWRADKINDFVGQSFPRHQIPQRKMYCQLISKPFSLCFTRPLAGLVYLGKTRLHRRNCVAGLSQRYQAF